MQRLSVQVECYAGSRADERPRRVRIEGRQYRVARLLSSSIEQSPTTNAPENSWSAACLECRATNLWVNL